MKSHSLPLLILLFLIFTNFSVAEASWMSKSFENVNKPLTNASAWVGKQSGIAKEQVKKENDPAKIKETATAAIEANSQTTQKALAEQKALIDDANAKLDVREKLFSASMIGLIISNGLTVYGLIAGRRRSREELRGLELENEKKELELQELKERVRPK
jgi:hypothetical protein